MSDGVSVPEKTADSERWTGTAFTFLSTLLYAISNVVIRYLSDPEFNFNVPNDWILFYKETIGLMILLPWLLLRLGQGRFRFTSKRLILIVLIAAAFCQIIGARLHVLGFAVIGLIITVPVVQASTLLGVAMIGYFVFGHSLSRKQKIAITILIVAITILSVGKGLTGADSSDGAKTVSAGYFLLVAAGTAVAGIAYAIYITMIRHVIRQHWHDGNSTRLSFKFRRWIGHNRIHQPDKRFYAPFPVTLMMALVFAVGVVVFGTFLYSQHGMTGFYNAPKLAWQCMLISGICNAAGFFFQIQGLRMTSAVQASLIAVSQMLLLSLIGFLFFGETNNMTMMSGTIVMFGLGLTVYGVFMSAKPEK
jgi:drug/metabolite transporter (DMT)-like permease